VLLDRALVHRPLREGRDRVALAPLLDLLLAAVVLGVGHRVASEAIGDGLDEHRLPLVAGAPDRLAEHPVRVDDVHPGSAAAPRDAVLAPEQLRHHVARVAPAGERVAVRAVGRDEVVLVGHRTHGPTIVASSPIARCRKPPTFGLAYISPARSSKRRISAIASSHSRAVPAFGEVSH